jgi:broad specificity phosphatase PhoE
MVDARLGEVCRPPEPIGDGHRAVRRDWVAGRLDQRHRGWESPSHAASRFAAAIAEHRSDTMVVATHGMVLTAWLVSIGHVEGGQPAARFWEAMALPDVVVVDLG